MSLYSIIFINIPILINYSRGKRIREISKSQHPPKIPTLVEGPERGGGREEGERGGEGGRGERKRERGGREGGGKKEEGGG